MFQGLAFIGLGSNLGDRLENLRQAARSLELKGAEIRLRSSVYRTDPLEVEDQGEFLNQVVGCESALSPEALLEVCLTVEREMGRVRWKGTRARDKGPRVIDLDLLLWGDLIRRRGGLALPHPRMHLRRFVLVPLAEIAPEARHPILGMTAAELLKACPDRGRVEKAGV